LPYNERWAKLETKRTVQLADSITNIAAVKSFAHEDQDAPWKLMKGRTAIVIAHRLSTIQKMDQILVLEKGTIVE